MKTTTSVKAGAAFLAGIVVALGGALVYLRATDAHSKPTIQVRTIDEPSSSAPERPVSSPQTPSPAIATDSTPHPDVKNEPQAKATSAKPVSAKLRITSRPVSLAVSHPKKSVVQEPMVQEVPPLSPPAIVEAPATQISQPMPPPPQVQAAPPPPQPHTVTIPAGTSVAIRLNEKLSTEHNFSGDTFRATLDAPIIMDGFIIADRGARVLGSIVKAAKPGKFEGAAELSLTLTEVDTTDGQRLHLQTNESLRKGPSHTTNEDVFKMGGGAALGAIIGAIAGGGKGAAIGAGAGGAAGTGAVLLGRGRPAVIDSETRLTFALASPTTITEQLKN